MNNLRIEKLTNGYYRVFDYSTKWSGLYNEDGTYHSGDLHLSFWTVVTLINGIR